MKKQVLLLMTMLLMAVNGVMAQAPNWLWAKKTSYITGSYLPPVTTYDAFGNVYIAGSFSNPTLNIGGITLNNFSNIGFYQDIYLAKFDANGNVIWAKNFGKASSNWVSAITTDANGNVYIAGKSDSSIVFGNDTLSGFVMFLAKFNSSGNAIWGKGFQGDIYQRTDGISVDGSGNIVTTGLFNSNHLTFGAINLTNNDTINNTLDAFVAKFNSNGSVLWAMSGGNIYNDWGNAVTTDASGNIFLTGSFSGSIQFGSISLVGNASTEFDAFIFKISPNGTTIWGKTSNGPSDSKGQGILTDASGNLFISGGFYSFNTSINTLSFGSLTLTNASSNSASTNCFWLKLDNNGNVLNGDRIGGSGQVMEEYVQLDGNGNLYVYGSFTDSINIGTSKLTVNGGRDIFIVKYNPSGNVLWAKAVGGDKEESPNGLGVNAQGYIYVSGYYYSSSVIFGSTTLTNPDVTGNYYNSFLAKLDATNGIEEIPTSPITLSPNPTTGIITIKGITQPTVEVYNLMGQKLVAAQNTYEVSLANLPMGLYLVQVYSKDMELVKSEKVIKE